MDTELMFSSKTDMWATPQDFFDKCDKEFAFTLDVCASAENHKCRLFFQKEDNGLSVPWAGNCWMNPPYGRGIGAWVKKARESSETSAALVVGLLPARTDTKWFHDHILGVAEIRFLKGRLKFGGSKNAAPFPSMLVIWRNPT